MKSEAIEHQIELARLIATAAHFGQFRRDGVTPYITHPEAVAAAVEDRLKPAAWLHDVIEDTWIEIDMLRNAGISSDTCRAVNALTRDGCSEYYTYIQYLISIESPDAITVKLADIRHNLSCQPSQNSIEKSKWAIPMLEVALHKLKQA